MSREGKSNVYDTVPLPAVEHTQELYAVSGDTRSIHAGQHNVEQLKMEHLIIFQDMKTSLANYLVRHTGVFGSMRRDTLPELVTQFHAYTEEYIKALYVYHIDTPSPEGSIDPRAHRFNFRAMQDEIMKVVTSVCDETYSELSKKRTSASKDEVAKKIKAFYDCIQNDILIIISRLQEKK
jgi:hypothetical protein